MDEGWLWKYCVSLYGSSVRENLEEELLYWEL
jgi:hypothetical protein